MAHFFLEGTIIIDVSCGDFHAQLPGWLSVKTILGAPLLQFVASRKLLQDSVGGNMQAGLPV